VTDIVPAPEPTPLTALIQALHTDANVSGVARVLTTALADLMPANLVTVERRRTMADRMARRDGEPVCVTIQNGDRQLMLRTLDNGSVEPTIGHVVRGVRLSATTVNLNDWLAALAQELERLAASGAASRAALERFLFE
jgi:hypothetical protein